MNTTRPAASTSLGEPLCREQTLARTAACPNLPHRLIRPASIGAGGRIVRPSAVFWVRRGARLGPGAGACPRGTVSSGAGGSLGGTKGGLSTIGSITHNQRKSVRDLPALCVSAGRRGGSVRRKRAPKLLRKARDNPIAKMPEARGPSRSVTPKTVVLAGENSSSKRVFAGSNPAVVAKIQNISTTQ